MKIQISLLIPLCIAAVGVLPYLTAGIRSSLSQLQTCVSDNLDKLDDELDTICEKCNKFSGSTFNRWGRSTCDGTKSSLVYKGYMAGPHHKKTIGGSGSNYLCLPDDPQTTKAFPSDWNKNKKSGSGGRLYGVGYELTETDKSKDPDHIDDKDVPCAVCQTERSISLMIPGRTSCYSGWNLEYSGYLMTSLTGKGITSTEYVCVDGKPGWYGTKNYNQAVLTYVEAQCGSLPCSKYADKTKLACVVCSK